MSWLTLLLLQSLFISTSPTNSDRVNYQDNQSDGIELIITNVRNKKGLIQLGLYDSDIGYPYKPGASFLFKKDSLISGNLRLFIPLKKTGSFAISILDDENMNAKMDYRLGIIPREGFGFSNNPKIRGMKEPSFEMTSFKYNGGRMVVTIRMVYI
jgi:uncharacterized protein (DUF2141 family)